MTQPRTTGRPSAAENKKRRPDARPSGNIQRRRPAKAPLRPSTHRRPAWVIVVGIAFLVGAVTATTSALGGGGPRAAGRTVSQPGPEVVPLERGRPLASAAGAAQGQSVDGIGCSRSEQVVYHVHTHLTVYVDGVLRPIPAGIGIVQPLGQPTGRGMFFQATRCYYWLHVHAQDGVIHIESPSRRAYDLGQFFDLWRQPLGRDVVGPVRGRLQVFVNGRRYEGDPRAVPLGSHEDVQIDVGSPVVPPRRTDWAATGL